MVQTVIDMRPQAAAELTTTESAELGRYEAVIKRGLDSFVEVGNALVAIRDGKLYRSEYSTFDEYCRGRWNISRSYAHRTIDAAQVVENLLPIGNILPANEAQARPLAKLEPEQQREVYTQAVADAGGKQPTAAQVERAVERVRPPRPKPTPPASKVVYTEPVAKAEASNPLAPRVTGIEKIDGVTVHHMEFAATLPAAPTPKAEPKASSIERINRDLDAYDAEARRVYAKPVDDAADEAEAIALVAAETAQEDAERAARDAQRPSYERVPEPEPVAESSPPAQRELAASEAVDNLDRLKRASLLRYMLVQARDAARRDYGDLTGRHTDMLEFERGVADMLPPLDSLIAILGGPQANAILEGTK